jgi:fructose-1,6-bisphosphatase/inositol monophosphatase family enzyme
VSVHSSPSYWLECDRCSVKSTEGSEHTGWESEASAALLAGEAGWLVEPGLHLCDVCALTVVCPECGERKAQDAAYCVDCAVSVAAAEGLAVAVYGQGAL